MPKHPRAKGCKRIHTATTIFAFSTLLINLGSLLTLQEIFTCGASIFQLRGVRNPQWLALMPPNLGMMIHDNLSRAFILRPWTLNFRDWNSHFFSTWLKWPWFPSEECSNTPEAVFFCDHLWLYWYDLICYILFILLMLPSDGRFDGWISRWIAKALPSCCMATAWRPRACERRCRSWTLHLEGSCFEHFFCCEYDL